MYIHICILYIYTYIFICTLYIYTYTFFLVQSCHAASCMMARARAAYVLNHFSRQVSSSHAGSVFSVHGKLTMLSQSSRAASCHF